MPSIIICSSTFSNGLKTNKIDNDVSMIACINLPINFLLFNLLNIATLNSFIPLLKPEIPQTIAIKDIALSCLNFV